MNGAVRLLQDAPLLFCETESGTRKRGFGASPRVSRGSERLRAWKQITKKVEAEIENRYQDSYAFAETAQNRVSKGVETAQVSRSRNRPLFPALAHSMAAI